MTRNIEIEADVNAFYQHNFAGDDHKLRLEINQSYSPEQEDNHYQNSYRVPSVYNEYDNTLIKQTDTKTQLVAEYSYPIDDNASIEAGYNGEITKRDMDFYGEVI